MSPLSIFLLPPRLLLLYFRSYVVRSLFPSGFQSYWSSQNHHTVSNLYILCYFLCLEYPPPSPAHFNLARSKESFKLRSWAISFRKISCFGSDAGLCSPSTCPIYTSLIDLTRLHGHRWFLCLSPTLNTLQGGLWCYLPSSWSMEFGWMSELLWFTHMSPICRSSTDLFPGLPQVLPSTLKVLSTQIFTCLSISVWSK